MDQEHLRPGQVAAYLDRMLSEREREEIEAHLAGCHQCRKELVEVARVRRARPPWRRWYILAPAAAAAAALMILIVRQPGLPSGDVVRSAPSEGVPRFATVSPSPTEPVASDTVAFVWRSAGADAHYRLTLTDPSGTVLWTAETADTVAALVNRVRLESDRRYFWYVDALLPSGESATTGIREFRTAP